MSVVTRRTLLAAMLSANKRLPNSNVMQKTASRSNVCCFKVMQQRKEIEYAFAERGLRCFPVRR